MIRHEVRMTTLFALMGFVLAGIVGGIEFYDRTRPATLQQIALPAVFPPVVRPGDNVEVTFSVRRTRSSTGTIYRFMECGPITTGSIFHPIAIPRGEERAFTTQFVVPPSAMAPGECTVYMQTRYDGWFWWPRMETLTATVRVVP